MITEEVRREEDEAEIDRQEHADADQILHRVIRMERNGVLRSFGVDAQRVVRLHRMQGDQMQADQSDDDEGQQVMQREKKNGSASDCRPRNRPTTT